MAKKNKFTITPIKKEVTVAVPTVSFAVWFTMRAPKIPKSHLKEVIQADFKGRGLSDNETVATFDRALSDYGIKL